jgi:hypothetical protein
MILTCTHVDYLAHWQARLELTRSRGILLNFLGRANLMETSFAQNKPQMRHTRIAGHPIGKYYE